MQGRPPDPAPDSHGARSCEECHTEEARRWRGSHHDLAMQEANDKTVLADFGDARLTYGGVTTRFHRKGGRPFVRTDGPDGRLTDYPWRTPWARRRCSSTSSSFRAAGSRRCPCLGQPAAAKGGQRWFHLYPGERVDHRDVLHWTKPSQNWNSQCAECHSTNLRKGYHLAEDRFETSFSEIDVSCEACHGPGSRHVEWAVRAKARGQAPKGSPASSSGSPSDAAASGRWTGAGDREAVEVPRHPLRGGDLRALPRPRGLLTEEYRPGRLLAATHRPALLDDELYYADGQMRDEVYNWGSFLQSRMYAKGVTCSDCHDPHDLKVKVSRTTCAPPATSRSGSPPAGTNFHREKGKGASCVACHMRTETYMVVDPRHDHSFRAPRPDLTVALGRRTPRTPATTATRPPAGVAPGRWPVVPRGQQGKAHWASALRAGRSFRPAAEDALLQVIRDAKAPGSCGYGRLAPAAVPRARVAPALEKASADPDRSCAWGRPRPSKPCH